jgi:hypothetical protein
MSTPILYDLDLLYRNVFGGRPYNVEGENPLRDTGDQYITDLGHLLITKEHFGKELWLPVKFKELNSDLFGTSELLLPYAVVQISSKKTIVKTALAERRGTVKELFSMDDYQIKIKGFLIDDEKRIWPEKEIALLKKLNDLGEAVVLDNALTNLFLEGDNRVVIESLDIDVVEAGRNHIRPFSMSLESDSVFTLELTGDV